jgi:cell shape-determining protein MreC
MQNHRQFAPAHTRTRTIVLVAILLVAGAVFAVPVLRRGLHTGIGTVGVGISRATHSVGGFFGSIGTSLRTKHSLETENLVLKDRVSELTTRIIERDTLARENADLKLLLHRNTTFRLTLAAVIDKPPHSVYDTLIIDGGSSAGFGIGQTVYANGSTPIGTIEALLSGSATVRLYSAPGQETPVRLSPSNVDITIVGRGGGNYSATIERGISVEEGATVVTKDINPAVVAVFKKITSDDRDPFQTLLFAAPVNINELSFVQVRQ